MRYANKKNSRAGPTAPHNLCEKPMLFKKKSTKTVFAFKVHVVALYSLSYVLFGFNISYALPI